MRIKILVVATLTALAINYAHAESTLPHEASMNTDSGVITLLETPCSEPNQHGFIYAATATEISVSQGLVMTHPGCWYRDGETVSIWFYDESPTIVATYRDYWFKVPPSDVSVK